MAKAVQKKAAKDYPKNGIKKGDLYWFAGVKTGPRSSKIIRSIKPIPRSQLTSSEYLSTLYDIEDRIAAVDTLEELESIIDDLNTLAEETRDKLSNMPDSLQQSDTGQLLEERAEACENAAQELDEVKSDWEAAIEEHESEVAEYEKAVKESEEEADNGEEGELEELPDDPGEFDPSEYINNAQGVSIG